MKVFAVMVKIANMTTLDDNIFYNFEDAENRVNEIKNSEFFLADDGDEAWIVMRSLK